MKLSNKQAQILLTTLQDSVRITEMERNDFTFSRNTRISILGEILNQQDGEVEIIKTNKYKKISES